MAESDVKPPKSAHNRAFARKVSLSKWALFFERLWPRLWVFLGVAALFALLSLAGLWPHLSELTHRIVLGAFALAALAALIYAARAPWPSREEAVRRIERRSGVAHRPATSYEDTLTANTDNPETKALWQAHRERLARAIRRLRVGTPSPRTDRFDPLVVAFPKHHLSAKGAPFPVGETQDVPPHRHGIDRRPDLARRGAGGERQ